MLEVVCWLWKPSPTYRSQFSVEHVNILSRMVKRNYEFAHRFNCITDQTDGFDPDIRVIPIWDDHARRESIYGPDTPSCYRRLRAFAPEMRDIIGPRFVSVDLDCVILGELGRVWNRKEPFIIWGDRERRTPYNGSMWMMDAGVHAQVWERFQDNPERAIAKARGAGYFGSDQAWISYALGKDMPRWTVDDGIYSYRIHVKPVKGRKPPGARILFLEGHYNPWDANVTQSSPWIIEHYR